MTITTIIIDDIEFRLVDLAQSCGVSPEWLEERVRAGLLHTPPEDISHASFTSAELTRTRRLRNIERTFDANPELAALVVDMMEEIERLRRQVKHNNDDTVDL